MMNPIKIIAALIPGGFLPACGSSSSGTPVEWHTDNTDVVSIDDNGTVRGLEAGNAGIWAENEG